MRVCAYVSAAVAWPQIVWCDVVEMCAVLCGGRLSLSRACEVIVCDEASLVLSVVVGGWVGGWVGVGE